jgi:sulfur carrier protein
MRLIVNGERLDTNAATVAALVAELGHEGYVAVAVNEEVVSRRNWADTPLNDGDALEVITPRQGG